MQEFEDNQEVNKDINDKKEETGKFNSIQDMFKFLIEHEILSDPDFEINLPYDIYKKNKTLNFNSISLFQFQFNSYLIVRENAILNEKDGKWMNDNGTLNYESYLTIDNLKAFLKYNSEQAKLYRKEQEEKAIEKRNKVIEIKQELGIIPNAILDSVDKYSKISEQTTPKTFEDLFYNSEHVLPCLGILKELEAIDAIYNYIGKNKGIFPLWIKVLKKHTPKPIIKPFTDIIYKDLLNSKIRGLNLSKDASEFRKNYKRLLNNKIELDIKTQLSLLSQSGKLGK